MANVKISQLPSGSIPTDNDYLPIVDFETLTTTAVRAAYLAAYISSSIQQLNLNSLTSSFISGSGLTIRKNQNASTIALVDNPFNGNTAATFLQVNSSINQSYVGAYSPTFGDANFANFTTLENSVGAGVAIHASTGIIKFLRNHGSVIEMGRFGPTGFFTASFGIFSNGPLSGTQGIFQTFTSSYGQFVQITGSMLLLDPTITDTSGNPIRLKIRSRSNVNPQMINLGDVNDASQLMLGTDGVSSLGTVFTNRGLRLSAGSTGLGFGDLSIGTSSAAGVFSERLGFRDTVGIANEATFNNPKNNYNFRVSAATNQNMIVVSASQNMIGIGIQPQESVHISGTAIRFDGPIYGYSSAYNNLTGNYVLTNADNGKVISINAAIQSTVTLPLNLTGGFGVSLFQTGIGTLFVTGVIGVTTFNRQNQFRTAGQYAMASLIYVSGNAYIMGGDTQL